MVILVGQGSGWCGFEHTLFWPQVHNPTIERKTVENGWRIGRMIENP